MSVPQLSVSPNAPHSAAQSLLVLGVIKTDDGPRLAGDATEFPTLASALAALGVTGAVDELRRCPASDGAASDIALIGLGVGEPTTDALRMAAGSAARQLSGVESLSLALPAETPEQLAAVLEGAAIGAYAFLGYRSAASGAKLPPERIVVHSGVPVKKADAVLARAAAVATAVHAVRDLVNTPPSDLYPESFAEATTELADGLPVELQVLTRPELEEGGFGGILAVGSGSVREPRLVVVRYSPEGATRHLAFVGKGITFDSGGLSLKPAAAMVGMKYDMTGAATALAVTLAAARLGLPVRITAWLCLAENMPSGSATRPNDVLRMRGGTTVEVLNTDAEGRLVLADGIVAASEEQPDAIVDVATLTGAARVAMGERVIPVMGDDTLVQNLVVLGSSVGETLWQMPLPAELRSVLDSDIADLANAKPGNTVGGMLVAGHFLKTFVGNREGDPAGGSIPWAHLDIAGAANNTGAPYGPVGKGATGVAVRTLIALTEDFSRP